METGVQWLSFNMFNHHVCISCLKIHSHAYMHYHIVLKTCNTTLVWNITSYVRLHLIWVAYFVGRNYLYCEWFEELRFIHIVWSNVNLQCIQRSGEIGSYTFHDNKVQTLLVYIGREKKLKLLIWILFRKAKLKQNLIRM